MTNLYTNCAGRPLRAPNDLVMDGHGGFYFTDFGIQDVGARTADLGAVYYARCDGSEIHEVAYPVYSPNGIGLSPDGATLYWAETYTGRLFRRRIAEPGVLEPPNSKYDPAALLCGLPGLQLLDSLAVDADGWVAVGTLIAGAVTSISPDGSAVDQAATGDPYTTNLCFGGPDMRTAFVTLSGTGQAGVDGMAPPRPAPRSPVVRSGRPPVHFPIWAAPGPDSGGWPPRCGHSSPRRTRQ